MSRIQIKNLKGIKELVFYVPSRPGVYLIAGSNGCGKTTLLTVLDRVCNNMAFAQGLSAASSWEVADQYINTEIRYSTDNRSVSYKKTKARWSPTPRRDSNEVFKEFGFSDSVFIRADSKRIDVKQEDIRKGNIVSVSPSVKDALNTLFETSKYNNLVRLKNSNGRGRTPNYFYLIREGSGSSTRYYSEKRFSTGELAMVRMIEKIESVSNGAMVLLDEAELALHPKVQAKMVDYLRTKANEKELRVFSYLIKRSKQKRDISD